MKPNFSGWITKYGIKCTDGRTIAPNAFAHQDGGFVPLVYQHNHTDVEQVLGKVKMTAKPEGIWGDVFLNESPKAAAAGFAVKNGDLDKFSVWAKDLQEQADFVGKQVLVHSGEIQEASLVLAGANSGAIIVDVLAHSVNGVQLDPDEDLLMVGGEIMHADTTTTPDDPDPVDSPSTDPEPEEGETVKDALDSLTEEQRAAVNKVIEETVTEAVTEALTEEPALQHSDTSTKGPKMTRNLHDRQKQLAGNTATLPQLKHDDVANVIRAAKGLQPGQDVRGINEQGMIGSLRDFVRSSTGREMLHADTAATEYGVQNIEILFPDAQAIRNQPTFVDRRQDWVKVWMAGTGHQPFSRIKTLHADITADEARARGWIRGNRKNEEVFPIFKRTTGPDWIYKKQALDRQDIIDIVDFDVVAWIKAEMRGKLDEEIARAGLFGDGRPTMIGGELNPDKIKEPTGPDGLGIRSVVNDDDLYAFTVNVPLDADATNYLPLLDASVEASEDYRGSGNKTTFMSYRTASKLLIQRDLHDGKRLYRNLDEVAGDMDVSRIVRVPSELFPTDLLAVTLDLADYTYGTTAGGQISLFDDFDIHFNKYYYLMETYLSGALILPYSAILFKRVDPAGTAVEDVPRPTVADNVITIPTATGVAYKRLDTNTVVAGGSTITLNNTDLQTVRIEAYPSSSAYYFESNADNRDEFRFTYKAPSA